ncbi:hypothetical protein H0H92_014504 [Tricholoma furcatifolium]|nr:hypothetical protein H0H92_014504 [Tricholoma furcatifolium]
MTTPPLSTFSLQRATSPAAPQPALSHWVRIMLHQRRLPLRFLYVSYGGEWKSDVLGVKGLFGASSRLKGNAKSRIITRLLIVA